MNLADCLARVPAAERAAMARAAGLDGVSDPEALSGALARPERVSQSLAALGPVSRDALILLAVGFDGQADRNVLARELGRLHPSAAGEALAVLERAALVTPRTVSPWLSALLDEAAPAARAAVAGWLLEACAPWLEGVEAAPATDPRAALADTARLLGAMTDGIRVRQEGGIYQADQRRLVQVLDHGRPTLLAPVFRGWAEYPSETLALHLALAMQLDLLEGTERGWRAAPAVEGWIDLPAGRQWGDLAQAWLDIGTSRLGARMQALLAPFAGGGWVDLSRWRGHLARYVHTYPPLPAAVDAVFLRPGLLLGALAAGRHPGGGGAVRLTEPALAVLGRALPELPPAAERVLVEADFEVVVPPGTPARVTWDLQRWAHLSRADRVARYRITRESVRHRSGLAEPSATWLAALAAEARFGLPDNVRETILGWALPARRATMRPAVALRFPDGEPAGWSPPAGAQAAAPGLWLLDLPAAVREAAALRRAGVVLEAEPEEWSAMEHARQERRRRAGPAPLGLPWPGPQPGDRRTPLGGPA